jgi:hypothetical protein
MPPHATEMRERVAGWRLGGGSTFSQLTLPADAEHFAHVTVVSSDEQLHASLSYFASLPPPPTLYGDAKVANREIRVWHGATGNGP